MTSTDTPADTKTPDSPKSAGLPAANLLDAETSPYLHQHRDNPVHWRAWGPAAFAEAKAADKPVLLSIGYAAATGATSWRMRASRTRRSRP